MTTDPLDFLFGLEKLGMKFGLENISRLCAALDHPERAFGSVIVAGTNGKGSVTAMVHRALIAAGHRAARYTSPHLQRLEERYVLHSGEVTTAALTRAAAAVRDAVHELQRRGELDGLPTFFECATAIAFQLFRAERVRIAVLEVGLGGRLDATNVVVPLVAAITSIDLDHQAQLGSTIEAIAFEKAGVIKPGIPVVCGAVPEDARRVIVRECSARGAHFVPAEGCVNLEAATAGRPLSLKGEHQRMNAMVAACVLREIDALGIAVPRAAVQAGLTDVRWPGRLEHLRYAGADFLLDAAHNPAGVAALAHYVRHSGWTGAAVVFGAMRDKDIVGMLSNLAPVCGALICTTAATARALPADTLAEEARRVPGAAWTVAAHADPAAAVAHAAAHFPRVIVAGSIFLIGPVRGILRPG